MQHLSQTGVVVVLCALLWEACGTLLLTSTGYSLDCCTSTDPRRLWDFTS